MSEIITTLWRLVSLLVALCAIGLLTGVFVCIVRVIFEIGGKDDGR